MHIVSYQPETKFLFVYVFGDLHGAETDDAILAFMKENTEEALGLSGIVVDARELTSADLSDTDGARVSQFELDARTSLGLDRQGLFALMKRLKIVRLVDEDSQACRIYLQRIERTTAALGVYSDNRKVFDDSFRNLSTPEEVAEFTGLDAALLRKVLGSLKEEAAR